MLNFNVSHFQVCYWVICYVGYSPHGGRKEGMGAELLPLSKQAPGTFGLYPHLARHQEMQPGGTNPWHTMLPALLHVGLLPFRKKWSKKKIKMKRSLGMQLLGPGSNRVQSSEASGVLFPGSRLFSVPCPWAGSSTLHLPFYS